MTESREIHRNSQKLLENGYVQCPDMSVYSDIHALAMHDLDEDHCPTCFLYKKKTMVRFGFRLTVWEGVKILWEEDNAWVDPEDINSTVSSLHTILTELKRTQE